MHEGNLSPAGPNPRLLIDEPVALLLELLKVLLNVRNAECYVVYPLTALGYELRYWRVFSGRLKKLNPAFSNADYRRSDLLVRDFLNLVNLEPKTLPDLYGLLKVLNGYTNVVYLLKHPITSRGPL